MKNAYMQLIFNLRYAKNKKIKPLVMMVGLKYGFFRASMQEICNGIKQGCVTHNVLKYL